MKTRENRDHLVVAREIIARQDTLTIDDLIWAADVMVDNGEVKDYEIRLDNKRLGIKIGGETLFYDKDKVLITPMKQKEA